MNLIEKSQLVLEEMKTLGCDEGSVSLGLNELTEIYYEADKISMVRTNFTSNGSLTFIKDKKAGNIVVDKIDEEALREGVKKAKDMSLDSSEDEFRRVATHSEKRKFNIGNKAPNKDAMYDKLNDLVNTISKDYPLIAINSLGIAFNKNERVFTTTNGAVIEINKGTYSIDLMFMAKDEENVSSFNGYEFVTEDLDMDLIDLPNLRRTLDETQKQIKPQTVEGVIGEDVIIHPSVVGFMTYFTLVSYLGDSSIYTGTSLWKDKKNEKVASPLINLSLNPLNFPGGSPLTVEGYIAENMNLIENGVLKNFVLSDYGARRAKMERSKNDSYAFEMSYGDISLEDMIKDVKKGILLNRFSGGSPAENGDFAGIAKNSMLIENGKIKCAVSEVMVSGNLEELWKKVEMISSEGINDGTMNLPYVRTKGLKVSGK